MSPTREERVISLVVWDGRASTRTRESAVRSVFARTILEAWGVWIGCDEKEM